MTRTLLPKERQVSSRRGGFRAGDSMEALARNCVEQGCPYSFYFRSVGFSFANGVLRVSGQVPSFYLKQILFSRLRHLDGVTRIDDDVDVISSSGLSSVRELHGGHVE